MNNSKLTRMGQSNATLVRKPNGVLLLVSYSTVVACYIPNRGYFKTSQYYSRTTSKHLSKWINSVNGIWAGEESPEFLAGMM